MKELKPCPFCGGKAYLMADGTTEEMYVYIMCWRCCVRTVKRCSSTFGVEAEREVIALWNRRVSE